MSQPQPRGFGVIGRHAQVAFDQWIQFVEQVRIHADADGNSEEAGATIAFKVRVFHSAQGDAPGFRRQAGAGCATAERGSRRSWARALAVPRGMIPRAASAANHALQNVVRRAVASAGEDRVAALGNSLARLLGGFGLSARGLGSGLDSGLLQHGQCRFHVRHPPLVAPAGERVVKKNGFAHE